MRVVFLSPHPDDVELFCGGTVALLAGRVEVRLVDLTRGELSSNGDVRTRAAEAAAAATALGVEAEREQLALPDAGLDPGDPSQVRALVGVVRRLRPGMVVAPWPEDRHPDHVAAGELARRALARAATPADPDAGAPHEVERLLFYPCHGGIEPRLLVDVSEVIDRWEAGVRSYASQFLDGDAPETVSTPINRPGFLAHHRSRRARWGARISTSYAEGFMVEGPWPVTIDGFLGR